MARTSSKVLVAMSGGVDSSVAALLLLQLGYEVVGATMDTGYGNAPALAKQVCQGLGIPHYVVDVRIPFQEQVVAPFFQSYLHGETPNPCVLCNNRIKFPLFQPLMKELGASYFSTGHYTRLQKYQGRYILRCATDTQKDQYYFLYGLEQTLLEQCLFPLGGMDKAQVRQLAMRAGLSSANQKDSYDICFIPSGNYREVLRQWGSEQLCPGEIVDQSGCVVGYHNGLGNYTLGQRRGLEIALGEPVYVLEMDVENNRLIVGPKQALMHQHMIVQENNFFPFAILEHSQRAQVKIRYKAPAEPATLHPGEKAGQVEVCFDKPQWGITPGQAAVYYDGDLLVGGGKIQYGF